MKLFALIALFVAGTMNHWVIAQKKDVTIEDVWQRYTFYNAPAVQINWMKNDNYYSTYSESEGLKKVSISNPNDVTILIAPDKFLSPRGTKIKAESYTFSDDESKVVLFTQKNPIYRRSFTTVAYVYDIPNQKMTAVNDAKPVQLPTLSPDGTKIGFIADNNLHFTDLNTNVTTSITDDGKYNSIINGTTDWVYEEEFGFTQGFYWSSDSKKVAYYRLDESDVKQFVMMKYGTLYPQEIRFKYPKAGEKNALVDIFIYDVNTKAKVKVDIGAEKDQYVPRIQWTNNPEQLAVMRLNRLQNKLEILLANASNGGTNVILTETDDKYITEVTDQSWVFLKKSDRFIFQSERDGYNHLYLYDLNGKMLKQITSGSWDVTAFYGIDERTETVFYQSSEVSPIERHVYSINLEGKKKERLTQSKGWHNAKFSSNFSYFMDDYSNASTPWITTLYDQKGKTVRVLKDNKDAVSRIEQYNISPKEFFTFKTNGEELYGWMIKPFNFDDKKKYPVLMFVYGGPGSQEVQDEYDGFNFYFYQTLAQQGYIIACVDNRGTGARGAKFKKITYGQLGKYETEDQIAAARYLAGKPFVDAGRIGIWGWSYGGYMSSLCLLKGNDVFKLAIAVAPVTNWRYYDTIYTERYMGLPQQNASGYDDNSPINHVSKLKGKYLLIHGTADDNVHYQNALEMVNALVDANKQFDSFFYPNRNHGISGKNTRLHLFTKMYDYITKNL
jgi:dipeptidyl-peptidase-4